MKRSKFKLKRWLNRIFCLQAVDLHCGYLGGLILLAVAILIRLVSGSPYRVYFLLKNARFMPSLTFFSLMNLVLTVAMGFACGLILSCRRRNLQCLKFQGGMLFVLLTVFWFITYPLVFRGCLLFAALLSLLAAWLLTLGCMLLFFRVQPLAGWISAVFLFWVTYLILVVLGGIFWI